MPVLRYNERGSVVIAAFTNAGLKCNDKNYDRYVNEVPNRPDVKLDSIMITPKNLTEQNSKSGLKNGLTHGMQFKKYGDDETIYEVVNQKVVYKNGKLVRWEKNDYRPAEGEDVRIFSELKCVDGKPIVRKIFFCKRKGKIKIVVLLVNGRNGNVLAFPKKLVRYLDRGDLVGIALGYFLITALKLSFDFGNIKIVQPFWKK